MKRLLSIVLIISFCSAGIYAQQAEMFQTYIVLNPDAMGDQYLAGGINADGATQFNGQNFGELTSFILNGGEIKTFKNNGGDVTGAELYYRVYLQGQSAPGFTVVNLPFKENLPPVGDQKWQEAMANINLIAEATGSGVFLLETYWRITTNLGDRLDDNSGLFYSATFSKSTVPVILSSFAGEQIDNNIHLEWSVVSEINNDYYTVDKNVNGLWVNIGTVHSKYGRSSDRNTYQFIDKHPVAGENNYRLSQTDYDGTKEELRFASIYYNQANISIYPNPFIDLINIKLPQSQAYQTLIIDMTGRVIKNHSFRGDFYQMDLQHITPGQYHLNILNQGEKLIHSSIISKLR